MTNRPLRHDSDHLRIFFVIYAVFFTFALRGALDPIVGGQLDLGVMLKACIAAVALALVGLRLIFAAETLSEHLLDLRGAGKLDGMALSVPFVHYPLLLLQGSWIYAAGYALGQARQEVAAWFVIGALWTNAVWLALLRWEVYRADISLREQDPRFFWTVNNALCGLAGLGALVLAPRMGVLVAWAVFLLNSVFDMRYKPSAYLPRCDPTPPAVPV